jgi:hypothetical protein
MIYIGSSEMCMFAVVEPHKEIEWRAVVLQNCPVIQETQVLPLLGERRGRRASILADCGKRFLQDLNRLGPTIIVKQ